MESPNLLKRLFYYKYNIAIDSNSESEISKVFGFEDTINILYSAEDWLWTIWKFWSRIIYPVAIFGYRTTGGMDDDTGSTLDKVFS